METMVCKECLIEKDINDFRLYKKNNSILKTCKKCVSTKHNNKYKDYYKERYQDNKEYINEKSKEWQSNNKEKVNEIAKKWRENNRENINDKQKQNRKVNKDIINEKQRIRYNTDELYRLKNNIRGLVYKSLKDKNYTKKSRTYEIIGLDYEDFMLYIESKFEDWMTWENYGLCNGELNYGWDIDHIIPLSSAKTEEDILKLNHYTNLQPLCSYINRNVKKDKLTFI